MNLTISVEKQLVERARKRPAVLGTSLNQLVRVYLQTLVADGDAERSIEEFRRLSGRGDSHGMRFERNEIHERR